MKKIGLAMAVVLALMVLSLSAVMATKEEAKVLLTVTSSKEKVNVGDVIEVRVSISENSDITALQFILSYDSTAVELLDEPILKHSQLTLMLNTDTPGKIGVYSYSNDVSKGISAGGVLFTATFKVLKPNATFNISDLQEAYDSNDDDISANVEMIEAVISCAHSHTETTVTKEADCVNTGVKTIVCKTCGEKVAEEEIAATGHTQGEWEVVTEADCTNAGLKRKSCTVCEEVLEEEEIPATGHTQGEWEVVTEATCTEPGLKKACCTVCGEKVAEEEIAATGHTQGEWEVVTEADCTNPGLKRKSCTVCEEVLEEEEIPATGHSQGEWEVVTEATCTEPGHKEASCTVCGEKLAEEEIPAKGHSFGEWVVVEEATVEKNGKEERTCTVCGLKETRETEKVTPEPTETPDVTPSPEPTETPEITPTEEPSTTPAVTPTDAPSVTPATGGDDAPVTGDNVHTGIFLAIMLITAAVLSVVIWKKKEA